jgi:hypothetical protein
MTMQSLASEPYEFEVAEGSLGQLNSKTRTGCCRSRSTRTA